MLAHILGRGQADAATIRRSAELLERQATQLTRLVDDLLDVARITRGRITLRREPLNLASVLDTALEAVKPLLEFRGQSVSVARGEGGLFVNADQVRLCQVVSNLLTNAIKYSPECARIEVQLLGSKREVALVVRDEGAGIDAQMLPHIFDLYLQGDGSMDRSHSGLGIGLTVVKHLVEMHDGCVEVHSEGLGKGSEFRVRLPRVAAVPVAVPDKAGVISRTVQKRRVLVVEDSRDSAESLRDCCGSTITKSKWCTTARARCRSSTNSVPTWCCSTSDCRAWMVSWWRTPSARALRICRSGPALRGTHRSWPRGRSACRAALGLRWAPDKAGGTGAVCCA